MAWDEGQNLTQRWEHVCAVMKAARPHWNLGTAYSGFADALVRETNRVALYLKQRFQQLMQQTLAKHWNVHGKVAFAVDGTRIECPRTRANEQGLGCAGAEKTAPQVYLTTLWHLGTGLPWEFRVGPGTDYERRHMQDMIQSLPDNSLLVADAGFAGYALCQQLEQAGQSFLIRVGGNVHLLTELGYWKQADEDTVYLWPEKAQSQQQLPLVLRLIQLSGKSEDAFLITNILNSCELSGAEARELYQMRWGEEVFHRSFKQTLNRRTLKSRTPATCLAEVQWTILGVWLLGLMGTQRLVDAGVAPQEFSVAKARNAVRKCLRLVPQRTRRSKSLDTMLALSHKDPYIRHGPKAARNFPRKKKETPTTPPKIKPAKTKQIQTAQQLPPPFTTTNRTA